MRRQVMAFAAFLVSCALSSHAGGPAFIAGSGYDPGIEGQPLVWAGGSVQYFTDQGDLSAILPHAQGDAFVAGAFNVWTGIAGVALTVLPGGHLAEDVNGSNIAADASGAITAPADITSSATGTAVGIVYDLDGTVTDALLGEGAGGLADCFTNAVYGAPDHFTSGGNIAHAFVVINGVCAATSAQLPDVQYRLVRVLGRILGLGWSQANLNVLTRKPPPTSGDLEGFPVMHFADPINCVPISACYPDAAIPKMDDANALARLYPASGNGQATARIYGSVYFTDASGNALQPMQGVNVVARLIDSFGQPSRQYVVTSVSGYAFHGNAGNIIDGYVDASGLRYDRWGSNDSSLEGVFDLGQLPIPTGQNIAQYQLSVEALDTDWSLGVEPYVPTQVAISGLFAPVVVTIQGESNAERDILMIESEIAQVHPGSGSTYANPAALPRGGAWGSWISGYGSADWFEFAAQANRTASVSVTAFDEAGAPAETKLLPVIGIWQSSDQSGDPAPASTPSAFNSTTYGTTRLDAQFLASDTFRLGVADFRGDGRPDYFYRASLLYSDTVTPARLSLAGGAAALNGIGFKPGLQVSVAGNSAPTLATSASQIEAAMPAGLQDGAATILVADPVTGGFSQMTDALAYGALATDLLLLVQGSEPAAPVGAPAANPIRVRVVAADGITPVNGATVAWSANNGLRFSVCSETASCSVLTDEAGESSSSVTPIVTGVSTITIALAPATYSPPQTKQATVVGTASTLDLVALVPTRWIGQGATIAMPLTVEALNLGVPKANVALNFTITNGTAALSSGTATTNGSGLATITAQITNQHDDVQVSACVAPNNVPCQTFTMFSTPPSLWKLETVSGSGQVVPTWQPFDPLVMRVTDGSNASNPVMGVNVIFATTLARVSPDPVVLGSSQAQVASAMDGLASMVPSVGSVGPCDVFVAVSAGPTSVQLQMESVGGAAPTQPQKSSPPAPVTRRVPDFAGPTSEPQGATALLFAVPQGMPGNEPAVSSDLSILPETSADDASGSRDLLAPLSVGSENADSRPLAKSKLAEVKKRKKLLRAGSGGASAKAPVTVEAQSAPPSSSRLPIVRPSEDKRSCRAMAGERENVGVQKVEEKDNRKPGPN